MTPNEPRGHVHRVKDLQPGDVLRSDPNTAKVVREIRPVEDDPTMCDVIWEPGRKATRTHWDARLGDRLIAQGPDAHYPVCNQCNQPWPCLHTRVVHELERTLAFAKVACHHCGQGTNGCKVVRVATVADGFPRMLLFHGRKGPCLTAARRLDPTTQPTVWSGTTPT